MLLLTGIWIRISRGTFLKVLWWSKTKMSLDEELELIREAERRYEILGGMRIKQRQSESEHPITFAQMSHEYMILHHPYSHLIEELGRVLQLTTLEPERLKSRLEWKLYGPAAAEILGEGGSLAFDRRDDVNW